MVRGNTMNFCNKEVTERIDNFITENKEQIVEELMELVRIPSVREEGSDDAPFGNGCKAVINAIAELYQKHGYYTKKENNNRYVMSYYGNRTEKQIGIFSHADVVPADGEWLICKPFEPIVKDGYMFGRGCNDDKSAVIQALYAAEIIKALRLPLKSELVMFAGSNEESGMADMVSFCENEKMPDVSLVPDGEYPYYSGEKNIIKFEITSHNTLKTIKKFQGGSATNIVLGELSAQLEYSDNLWEEISKVCANDKRFNLEHNKKIIKITAKGKSNHIAKISDSVNAAKITAEKLYMCESICEGDKIILNDVIKFIDGGYGQGFGIEHIDKDFGALVCGNGIVNTTPDGRLKVTFDVRSGPSLETDRLIDLVTKTTQKNWEVLFLRNSKGYVTDESGIIPTTIRDVYKYLSKTTDVKTLKISGGTYARMLKNAYAIGNIAPYKTKPISLPDGHGGFHQPDEKLSIDGFLEGIKILVCMVMEIDALIN